MFPRNRTKRDCYIYYGIPSIYIYFVASFEISTLFSPSRPTMCSYTNFDGKVTTSLDCATCS